MENILKSYRKKDIASLPKFQLNPSRTKLLRRVFLQKHVSTHVQLYILTENCLVYCLYPSSILQPMLTKKEKEINSSFLFTMQEWQILVIQVHVARILNVLTIITVLCVHACQVILAIQHRIVNVENVKVRKIIRYSTLFHL